MAFHLYEDTWETTTTTGTGAVTLGGAVTGWRAFSSQYADGDTMFYSLYDGTNFEHGVGTYNAGANTLTRTTVIRSTNSNAAVNFGAGTKQVSCSQPGYSVEGIFGALLATSGYPRQTAVGSAGTPATFTVDARGQLIGTATNDNAAAGFIGEYIESVIASGSAVSLSNGVAKTVTSISLTAGDWDVWGEVWISQGSGVVATAAIAGINTSTNTLPAVPAANVSQNSLPATLTGGSALGTFVLYAGTTRWTLSGTTSAFLVANLAFTGGTESAYGRIAARRRR